MTLHTSLKKLFLFVFLTKIATNSNAQKRTQTDEYSTIKAALNKKVYSSNKSYYMMIKATDSTVHLFWGNDTLKRMFGEELSLWPAAERLFIKWYNKNYLILEYSTGSETWTDILLPLDKKQKTQEFYNGIYFDKTDNLFVFEGYSDTILVVKNLKTKREQFIIDKKHCCAVYNDVCIDSVRIKNNLLYLEWTPDNCSDNNNKTFTKKIKLKI